MNKNDLLILGLTVLVTVRKSSKIPILSGQILRETDTESG